MPARARRTAGSHCSQAFDARVRWLRGAYQAALVRELAVTVERPDGCRTTEDLDDAWHVGVADPPVGQATFRAWQALIDYLVNTADTPAAWPVEVGHRPAPAGPGRR